MPEPTETTIDAWISPATTTLSGEDIKTYLDVIAHASSKVTATKSSDLVAVAYRVKKRPEAIEWLTELIRTKKTDFPTAQHEDLLSRVACCIAVRILDSERQPSALLGLLAQSAMFVGAQAPIEELAGHANAAVTNAAIAARQRPVLWAPIAAEVANFLNEVSAPPTEGVEKEAAGYEKAITRLAGAIDFLAAQSDKRAMAVDEEYNALWWSYTDRSISSGERWEDVKPLSRRVVLLAHELGRQMIHHPGPPMVRGLLGAALGGQADKQIVLAEVALVAAEERVDLVARAKDALLPISSAVTQIAELGSDSDTWKEVLDKSLGLKPAASATALETAMQLFREVEIGKFLE